MPNATLVVIGAGPRALAIHVRAKIRRELGHASSDVVIIEPSPQVGAHWDGSSGYTDGTGLLVTPPEKDIGFPYRSAGDSRLDRGLAQYSWHAYLVATGQLSRWIDHGRPAPSHAQFAEYLRWVAITSSVSIRSGRVEEGGIEMSDAHWSVTYRDLYGHHSTIACSGIVITGPGEPRRLIDGQPEHFNVSDGSSFWLPRRLADFRTISDEKIAVIGNGDTAASIVVKLLDTLPHGNSVEIDLFCRRGLAYSRAESAAESEFHSDPTQWHTLDAETRKQFILRTERGVFSGSLKSRIDTSPNVRIVRGMVRKARMRGKQVHLTVQTDDGSPAPAGPYRRVVVATGFRRWGFQRLFADQALFPLVDRQKYGERWEERKEARLAEAVRSDLSYPVSVESLRLYLPALGALAWGPGFANLGCLGLMSARILDSHHACVKGSA